MPQTALQREAALNNLMGSCLRRAVGVRTRADSIAAGSLSAHLVGSATSEVRSMLCVVGPSAVDLAALWFSEDGSVLCSCWEHTQNVALLRLTGKGSSCWHARCFSKAMEPLEAHREELESTMRVKDTVEPHAVLVELPTGCAAVAYDGEIFSPVVASKKRYIKCISVGCRSTQRRCQHAILVRALPRFCDRTDGGGAENDSGEDPRDTPGVRDCESLDGADAVDDEELVAATLLRARRNLVACMEEDKLCEKWARSADWAAMGGTASDVFGTLPAGAAGSAASETHGADLSPMGRLARFGLVFDPGRVLVEQWCQQCGAEGQESTPVIDEPALLYTDGNGGRSLKVCLSGAFCCIVCPVLPHRCPCAPCLCLAVFEFFQVADNEPCLCVSFTSCFLHMLLFFCSRLLHFVLQLKVGTWTCPADHLVRYDGSAEGLFSLQQCEETGSVLLFTRGLCDSVVSFVFHSHSSYAAATAFLGSLRSDMGIDRQTVVDLGRLYTACLQPSPDLFVCPRCGDNPDYIVIDGQALGFKRRSGMRVMRPAQHLPGMNISTSALALLAEARLRSAIRKTVRSGEDFTKDELGSLRRLHVAASAMAPRVRKAATIAKRKLTKAAASLLFTFFPWVDQAPHGASGAADAAAGGEPSTAAATGASVSAGALTSDDSALSLSGSDGVSSGGGGDASQDDGLGSGVKAVPTPRGRKSRAAGPPVTPWHARVGTCRPDLTQFDAASTNWASVRPFVLANRGDPVVNLFQGHALPPVRALGVALQGDDDKEWVEHAEAANAVGFVANFFGRLGRVLTSDAVMRKAVGVLLQFCVEVEAVADAAFDAAADRAAANGKTSTKDYCEKWKETSAAEYEAYAKTDPTLAGKDLDSPFTTFEFFGFLRRVRPAIFTPRARGQKRQAATARSRRNKGAQAALEDAGDRCSKSFPKHKDLTAGVFNIVCPHVVTMGFRVMFEAESVADALSVILERFPKLPKVVFYDVACKIDRNAMQRVRSIISHHGVRFCLDRVHAKGHTCSCLYFPDESLSVTNGVSTQAAEVQHSVSVKFRGHLAYMSPASFMAHRIVQLSLMNLAVAYKLQHPQAKAENESVRFNAFYFSYRDTKCLRRGCSCS